MKNYLKNGRFLDAKNLFPCVTVVDFMLFSHWRKNKKIDAKMGPKSYGKSLKMEPGGDQGRFILHFYGFWEKSEKHDFSMTFRGDQKASENGALAPQGRKKGQRGSLEWCIRAPDRPPGRG